MENLPSMMALCLRSALIRACDRHAKTLRAALETEKPARGKPDGLGVSAPPPNLWGGGTSEDGQGQQGKACPKAGKAKNLRGLRRWARQITQRQNPPEHRGGENPPEGETSAEAQRGQTLSEGKTSARQKPSEGKTSAKEKPQRRQTLSGYGGLHQNRNLPIEKTKI